MIDTKLLLRKAYFQSLNGSLTYSGNNVPVYDDIAKLGNADSVYVLMEANTSSSLNTAQYFSTEETFTLRIVFVAAARVNKEVLDIVANQILNIVCPNPQQNGLSAQPGISIINLYKSDDFYMPWILVNSKSVISRLITFSQMVTETGFGGILPPYPGQPLKDGWIYKYTSADFVNATDCPDIALNNLSLAVYYNDNQIYLDEGIGFENLPGGGFRILLAGFDAQLNNYTFYVSIIAN